MKNLAILLGASLFFIFACKKEKVIVDPDNPSGMSCDIAPNTGFPAVIPGWEVAIFETGQPDYRDWETFFINESTGFLYETNGNVLRTADGGATWQSVLTPSQAALRKMIFADENNGFLSAQNISGCSLSDCHSVLFKSTNGGLTWKKYITNQPGVLWDVYFKNETEGIGAWHRTFQNAAGAWAGVSNIARTSDGGLTWEILTDYELTGTALSLQMVNDDLGFFPGKNGKFYRTTDGGQTFENISTPLGVFYEFQFLDAKTGFVSNFDTFFKTTDGGLTWDTLGNFYVEMLHFTSPEKGLVLKIDKCVDYDVLVLDGGFLETADGGLSWAKSAESGDLYISGYHFPSPDLGFVVWRDKLIRLVRK